MSQANVEIVRALYEAWQRGDYEAAFELIDGEIEWFGPPDVSNSGVARGHEGMSRSLATWVGTWDDYHFELRHLIDCGDDVLAEGWHHGRGRSSGVEVAEDIFSVWTLRAGKVVRQRMFRDRAQAFETAGFVRPS
jgi:ketosteroid isomerase-like protein